MSKPANVAKANPVAEAIAYYNTNPGKGVARMVKDAITAYTKVAVRLHFTACFATYHAATTGDPRPLNTFFNGLRQNDKDALRLWVGKAVTFEIVDEETGETSERKFISFKKDGGFDIIKGTEEVRKAHLDIETMLNGLSFLDINQAAETKTLGLAEILAALARLEKQTTKKAEENGVELPATLRHMLTNVTATVAAVGNTLGTATKQ